MFVQHCVTTHLVSSSAVLWSNIVTLAVLGMSSPFGGGQLMPFSPFGDCCPFRLSRGILFGGQPSQSSNWGMSGHHPVSHSCI